MIKSWANSRSRRFYFEGKASKFRGLYIEVAEDLLAALDAATALKDLSTLKIPQGSLLPSTVSKEA